MFSADSRTAVFADRLLAAAFIALTQLEIWVFEADARLALGLRIGVAVTTFIAASSLASRRTRPMRAFIVNSAAIVASISLGFPSNFYQWTNLVVTYSVAAHGTARQAWWALPFSLGGVAYYFIRLPAEGGALVAGFAASLWLVGWLAGRMYGSRLEEIRLRAERDLSVQLAETRQERLALEAERTRIARELHDIIGHSVNVMVIHAGAGRGALAEDPTQAMAAFATIEETGRRALGELDRVLAVLRRDEEAGLAPAPGIERLADLAETFEAAGLPVDVSVEGSPDMLPQSVSLSTYRVVQEALTNVLKHSGAMKASVEIAVGEDSLDIEVADDGGASPALVEGRGITGMRERVALHNGSLEVRSAADGVVTRATLRWTKR